MTWPLKLDNANNLKENFKKYHLLRSMVVGVEAFENKCVCVCIYIYIYIYIERERERDKDLVFSFLFNFFSWCMRCRSCDCRQFKICLKFLICL